MNTNTYCSPSDILSVVTARVADRDFKSYPKSLYISFIQRAFEALAIDTFFDEQRENFDFPLENLTLPLPEGCFNVRNVYMYSGTDCDFHHSRKVYWKRNYYTEGNGYIANDKGQNVRDPFYGNRYPAFIENRFAGTNIQENLFDPNRQLFYNIQRGSIMFSSSCRSAGNKVHIHYNGTGCAIGEIPIIPIFLRTAIEDFLTIEVLLLKIGEENDPRRWQSLLSYYTPKLDREGYNGSWHNAELRIKTLNQSQRDELSLYLGRASWQSGM